VIRYTHYIPDEWKDQMHAKQVSICAHVSRLLKLIFIFAKVHQEFGDLLAHEISDLRARALVSIVLTPFVLWFSLLQCCTRNY
jgi:autophagy-related protein 9